MFMAALFFRHGIITAATPGIAAYYPLYAQPATFKEPMPLQRFNRIL